MRSRPRLLFLAQTLPFPPDTGVAVRTFNVMRLLARAFDVTALCFYRTDACPSPAAVRASVAGLEALPGVAAVEAFPIPQEHGRARLVWDHLRSVATGRPYTVFSYESAAFRGRLEQLLRAGGFDLAHVDSLDLSAYLPLLEGIPVACVHHNVESALLRRRAASERSAPLRRYVAHQAGLLEAEERRWCPRVALNVAVSDEDRRRFEALVPGARFAVVPNGVDTHAFRPPPAPGRDGLVFVGGYGWYPNRDALEHFAEDVLPLLRGTGPEVPVRWVGRAPEPVRRDFRERHGIELTGYVDDTRPLVHAAACYVVPLRVGGGTRLKILDAWAMGKAVVSTPVGCEGLDARDGENILVRDDPAEFAAAVRRVLDDEALRARLGEGARRTAEEVYEWDVIGRSMTAAYLSLAERRGAAEPAPALAAAR
ncbi:MAG: glycosyltransferase family 4 protein [Gemmatimonadota bacterium]